MVPMDEYVRIRQTHRQEQLGVRALAKRFQHSRRKIREILAQPEPKPYKRQAMPSVIDPFKTVIDTILLADEQAPRKQRHTVAKLFRRLRDEHGYPGGYERVRLYLLAQQRTQRETFIPLDHDPGQRLEADFGHIHVQFPEGRRLVPVLLTTWSYSNCPFALALPTERTEAILHGLVEAFTFFGCVPRELWWDNPKTVAAHLLAGRARRLNERYQALVSHYAFEALFCRVRRPQEKPRVENRVRHLQRDWATPVPQVRDLAELNARLRACCLRDRDRTQSGQTQTIGQRFAQDVDKALSLTRHLFDPCLPQPAKVDKYQMVRCDSNRYSVPRSAAFQTVTVKAYVERVDVVLTGQVIASHPRSYAHHEQVLDPHHYLDTLGRRPAALDHADVFRRWQLPAVFGDLRQALERQHGPSRGAKHYVRVLQLLPDHTLAEVQRALATSRTEAGYDVEALLLRVRGQAAAGATPSPASLDLADRPEAVRDVRVPLPDVRQFDQLLSTGAKRHERNEYAVTQEQPETTAAADHACRVRGLGPRGGDGQRELPAVSPPPDGTGSGGPGGQRAQGPHQTGELPGSQGLRQLRLHGPALGEQAEDPGAGAGPVDRGALQRLLHRQLGDGQDALGHSRGLGGMPAGAAGALLHGGRLGQSSGGSPETIPTRPLPGATPPGRSLDLRRVGLPVVEPDGGGVAFPGVRRPLRTAEPVDHQQSAVRGLGADLPRRTDDSGLAGSADAPLPHLRDEWRKLSLPRVDESQEGQGRQVSPGQGVAASRWGPGSAAFAVAALRLPPLRPAPNG
jgi:transposase